MVVHTKPPKSLTILRPSAAITIEEVADGKRIVSVTSNSVFISKASATTSYPVELIERILCVKGPSYLCDEIARDCDPGYVQRALEKDIFAYASPHSFDGKRVLDFGCGSGASTMVLGRLLPRSEIVGIELSTEYLDIAKARLKHYSFTNIQLLLSPSGTEVPQGIGAFDAIIFSAVFEHLWPDERRDLMPRVWSLLKRAGILFLDETPYRYFPLESHTTGLWFINYLPDWLAKTCANKLSKRGLEHDDWPTLLRKGVRGGTASEVLGLLGRDATLLEPQFLGFRDRIDLWYEPASGIKSIAKASLRSILKAGKALTGVTIVPSLSLAIRKN